VIEYGRDLFATRRVGEEKFQAVLRLFGTQGLVELTTLMGYYAMLAFNANAVELDVHGDGSEAPLPV
jgi:hypothetical protein